MFDFGFDGINAVDAVLGVGLVAFFPDKLGGLSRDNTQFSQFVSSVGFDFEPDTELVRRFPDGCHLRTGITGDHAVASGQDGWVPEIDLDDRNA